VLAELEAQADTGICSVCGLNDLLKVKFGGRAFFHEGRMTPWLCPDCAAAWLAAHPGAD
jgi:rubrerythrin